MTIITSLDDPRIAPYRSLRELSRRTGSDRLFIVENSKVIRRLLKSDCAVRSFFATPHYYEELATLLAAKQLAPEQCFVADEALMSRIVGYALHEGVMALALAPEMPYLLPNLRTIELPAVCLCGLADAENVGAIVRNCAAFGVRSLVVDNATCSPYLRRAVRVSLGGIFALSVYRTENLAETLTEIKHLRPSMRTIALETRLDAHGLDSYPIPQESMLLFGSEGAGIAAEVLAACDAVVQIPMQPLPAFDAVNSLNVAASTAVVLYHLANGASA